MIQWTYEQVTTLESLWLQGLSAEQCAQALGSHTRMQVICKVNHMGLCTPEDIDARETKAAPPEMRPALKREREKDDEAPKVSLQALPARKVEVDAFPAVVVIHPAECFAKPAQGLSIGEITDKTCKWPCGDPGTEGFFFCGRKTRDGSPYCDEHHRLGHHMLGVPRP